MTGAPFESHGACFFVCRDCESELTDIVEPWPESRLDLDLGASAVPRGRFVRVSTPWTYRDFVAPRGSGHSYAGHDGERPIFAPGDFLLAVEEVRFLVLPGASYGCCGLMPTGEINGMCSQGHPICSAYTDCWAASVVRLDGTRVRLVRV